MSVPLQSNALLAGLIWSNEELASLRQHIEADSTLSFTDLAKKLNDQYGMGRVSNKALVKSSSCCY